MVLDMETARRFLGKPVLDPAGANIGRLVGLSTDMKNEVTSVEIEFGNGEFQSCPISQFKIIDGAVVFIPAWQVEAENLNRELEVASKRISALSELYRSGEIQKEIYDELCKQHEAATKEIYESRKILSESLRKKIEEINEKIGELESFLANNKIQHASKELDDEAYKIASSSIQSGIKRTLLRRESIERLLNELEKVNSTPSSPQPEPSTPKGAEIAKPLVPEREEGVMVVHIEEESE